METTLDNVAAEASAEATTVSSRAALAVPTYGDKAFLVDLAPILIVSALICIIPNELALMTVVVPAILLARLVVWTQLPYDQRQHGWRSEVVFYLVCTVLGGFNDWNSVVNHGIYDYTVAHYFPDITTIPIWMLLFWGMILRFFVTLFRYERFDPPKALRDAFWLPGIGVKHSGKGKVITMLLLVLATRQTIYRFYLDPILSWLPFAIALVVALALFRFNRYDAKILLLFAIGGTLIEVLYINVGQLHRYHLGWIGGVPLWIALWWVVIGFIWNDLASRMLVGLKAKLEG